MMTGWTDAQKEAIYSPSGKGNILVSAAAGSGKTAVLVERIVDMILRDDGTSIDRLLVVTFTEAAAAEMKERIMSRISKAYKEAMAAGDVAKGKYLREQSHLTSTADINTIDAFCLNVVKNNFHILGIDPNFSIMDTSEEKMIIDDVLSDLFMSLYASEDKEEYDGFIRLVKVYASNRDDEGLKKLVGVIYKFIQSFPEPEKWLCEKRDMYSEDMTESVWVKEVLIKKHIGSIINKHKDFWEKLRREMLDIVLKANNAEYDEAIEYNEKFTMAVEYWDKVWKNVCSCCDAVSAISGICDWDSMYDVYNRYFAKKSLLGMAINIVPKNKIADDEEWKKYYDKYNYMRDDLRSEFLKLPTQSKENFNDYIHAAEIKQAVDDITSLVIKFSNRYEERKAKRNLKTFSDIEHLAYRLFSENENIRSEYAQRYDEILIDEYQDTNGLQDSIFSLISNEEKNRFMVGDLKQSIYLFRGGDPSIFKSKNRLYSDGDGGKRVSLSQNFRSRREVLESINAVFEKIMSDEVGDVVYNSDEALNREAQRECYIDGENLNCETNKLIGYNSEFHRVVVIEDSSDSDENVTEERAECACVAERIRELVDGHFKIHIGGGEYRDIEYRDIVVLMREVKKGGAVMRDMLESRNIPAFVQREEYFEKREIKLMMSLISLINNNMQDIPLVAVMRSPIGGFTETELARIRLENKGRPFYNAVKYYKVGLENMTDDEERLRNKCRRFIGDLNRWRGYVKMKPIASLIWTLYQETGLYDFMGALEGGEEAQANLKLLYERARRYEASGFKGIFNFIRYIERMERRNDDLSGAKLVNENHNVVRIMTIHKSKGLEFPVVFLSRTTKQMVVRKNDKIPLNKDLGFGMDYYNYEDNYYKKLLFSGYVNDVNYKEQMSESLRLMYVAMTRAKEKLIVTSVKKFKNEDLYQGHLESLKEKCSKGNIHAAIVKAKSYYDWIAPVLSVGARCWDCYDKVVSSLAYEQVEKVKREDVVIDNPDETRKMVEKILEFKYKYPKSGLIPAKTSVTAIKEMEDEEHKREDDPVFMTQKPKFLREAKLGAQIGTAHHQVMAYIDLAAMKELDEAEYERFIGEEIVRIAKEGQIEKDIAEDEDIINLICNNVCGFFKSEMGEKLFNANAVYRERSFEIEIPACEYDSELTKEYEDEKVVVQGIIDLYFEDCNGDIILVDYKTDRCKTDEEQAAVAQKYRKQLELYERAMEKILKKSVKDKYLYLFSAQNVVKLV